MRVHLPDRLDQGVQRDRVVRVLLGQLHELRRQLVLDPVHAADERHPLLVRGHAALRRGRHEFLVARVVPVLGFLQDRLVLLRRRGRPVLGPDLGRDQRQAEREGQESPDDTVHGVSSNGGAMWSPAMSESREPHEDALYRSVHSREIRAVRLSRTPLPR